MIRILIFLFSIFLASFSNAQIPVAQFSANQFSACAGFPITFTDLSNYGGSAVISTNWDFGEGGQSTNTNPTYTYMTAGTYQVLLTVISASGTDFELKLNYITVFANPIASFTTSGNGCSVPFAVTFNNTSTTGAGINYNWNFGNGQTSTLQNPASITYNANGNYDLELIVTNSVTGCVDTTNQTIVVSDFAAGINAPLTGCVDQVVAITDGTTVGVNTWSWTSGDGQVSNVQNPSFSYAIPGTYTITLVANNSVSGCSDNVTQNITINPISTPSFTALPTSGCAPLQVTYTNTSGAGSFLWDFGAGLTSILSNPLPVTYNANGIFDVSLTMTDANGCISTTVFSNMITVAPPAANFSSDFVNGCAPLSVQFSDLSTSSNPISDPITSWLWSFGDGTTFNGQNPPSHIYGLGTFDVSLTITTQSGCTNTLTTIDAIQVGMIDLVDFSLFPIIECAKHDITFTDLSVISTPHDPSEVIYDWDFGDGGHSSEQNPIYNYPIDTGMFDIQLIVDFRGCKDTLKRIDQIYIKAPISKFTVQNLYCNPLSFPVHVVVTDNAIAGAATDNVDMIWSWGVVGDPNDFLNSVDVFDANQGDTAHDYLTYGTYTIKQVVHNYTTGCADSTEQIIIISSMDAGFLLSNDTTCNSLPFTITSSSTYLNPLATFTYDMGNGDIIVGDPLFYTYNVPGTYDISMIATNSVGCVDSAEFLGFHVLDPPLALLTGSDDAGCLPINVIYTNNSIVQGNGVPLSSFLWTFPDGTTQTTNNVATTTNFDFSSEGFFTTLVSATDVFGCTSPPTGVFMLITNPTVNFTMDSVVCDLENFNAVNTTTGFGIITYDWDLDAIFATNTTDYSNVFDETESSSYTNVAHAITLVATDGNGCKDSITKIIKVSLPKADLNYIASGATANGFGEYTCPPVFETYSDLSTSYGSLTNWSWSFGDGKTSAFENPNNTYVFPGTYSLSLNITDEFGCTADTILVDYLTILGPGGTLNWTIVGDQCEHNYAFEATDLTFVDSIVWDLDDGTILFDSTFLTHSYAIGSYEPTCTLIDFLGCEVTYPMQTLVVPNIVLFANAGPDQSFCGSTAIMAASPSPDGVGIWTLINGSGIITFPDSATTDLSGLGIGLNEFVWTVTNACDTILDTMSITITASSTVATTGPDQILCVNATILTGNAALSGNGLWSIASGSGIITDITDPVSTITAMGIGVNQFVWTIANVCSTSSDTLKITVETIATIADAGPDKTVCGTVTNLEGNLPISGNGIWSIFSGSGTIADNTLGTSGITNLGIDTNLFVWTISNSCGTTSDTVQLIGVNFPIIANAGVDQFICQTNSILSGNDPISGAGVWVLLSGSGTITSTSDTTANVTGLTVGENVFAWVITTFCEVVSDQVTITLETTPTIADAGPDQITCGTTTNLAGVAATVGVGTWTLVSGTGIITSPNSPVTGITGLGIGLNVFQWTVINSCASTVDQVAIVTFAMPTVANAGADQFICADNGVLTGNNVVVGNGIWTLISGGATITTPTNPNSTVTNLSVGPNVFQWTITNPCGTSSDQIIIIRETPPPIAGCGEDQTICGGTAILTGNSPNLGNGTWTLISGEGSINTVSDSASGVSGLGIGVNVFEWTISNSCSETSELLTITNSGQCPDLDSLNDILYFYVPNTFTPNDDDDINKFFQPIFTTGYDDQSFTLLIFNRWGQLIFESHDAEKGWNGKFGVDGEIVQDDTYTWKISFIESATLTEHKVVGHVNVLK